MNLKKQIRHLAETAGVELPQKGRVLRKEIRPYLPEWPVVVEAGAHVGTDTAAMAKSWPEATVHAFEPVPEVYNQLVAATRGLGNVRTYRIALAENAGERPMFISSGDSDGSSSLLAPKDHLAIHPGVRFSSEAVVPTTTLAAWAQINGVARVDLLWLDAQGAELHILKSAGEMLDDVVAIYSEVNMVENYSGCVLYPELRTWLAERGFRPAIERIAWADGGNVLFVR